MIDPPTAETTKNTAVVICDSETARQSHKNLFRSEDDKYIILDETSGIINSVSDAVSKFSALQKIHLVMGWPNILQISLWQTAKPSIGDIFTLLRNEGIGSTELQPFKTSDINDFFPWLYYGKRFDVLRKICHTAKRKVESSFKKNNINVECHIIAEDAKKIIASSL